jgi:hypothetical protein
MIREIDLDIDHTRLLSEFHKLNITELFSTKTQIALQCRLNTSKESQLSEGCGSLVYNWDLYDPSKDTELATRDEILAEPDFDVTCDLFKNTYFEEVIDAVNTRYSAYRGRLMMMPYKQCLSMHSDATNRIHIPLITNPYCFMVIANGVYRLATNKTYIVNTRIDHTAVNAGRYNRIHLVFCTDMEF